jgi:alkylated DNA repair dioxygenase AlkB
MLDSSNITLLSLGDAREFDFTSESGVEQERVVLEDGDLFVLQATNATPRHVLPVKDELSIRDEARVVPRISASG